MKVFRKRLFNFYKLPLTFTQNNTHISTNKTTFAKNIKKSDLLLSIIFHLSTSIDAFIQFKWQKHK